MMVGKLKERASLKGGSIEGVNLINAATFTVDEDTARLPSYYRAFATAQDESYTAEVTIPRATVGAKGAAVTGLMRIKAAVSTSVPVVQKFTGSDGVESKRVSTSESTWGAWRKVFDEVDKPSLVAGDVAEAGDMAQETKADTRSNLLTMTGPSPRMRWEETGQADPAGRAEWRMNSDVFELRCAATAVWGSFNTAISVNRSTRVVTFPVGPVFTAAPTFTDASGSRSALGLGTAAVKNTGTSGNAVPLLDAVNIWSGVQSHQANLLISTTCFLQFGGGNVTIASGVIAPTRTRHTVIAESGTADDLVTISSPGSGVGQTLLLSARIGDTITVKDGTGNIQCGADFAMGSNDRILLEWDSANWLCISKQIN